jgi:hypothetical protein
MVSHHPARLPLIAERTATDAGRQGLIDELEGLPTVALAEQVALLAGLPPALQSLASGRLALAAAELERRVKARAA